MVLPGLTRPLGRLDCASRLDSPFGKTCLPGLTRPLGRMLPLVCCSPLRPRFELATLRPKCFCPALMWFGALLCSWPLTACHFTAGISPFGCLPSLASAIWQQASVTGFCHLATGIIVICTLVGDHLESSRCFYSDYCLLDYRLPY